MDRIRKSPARTESSSPRLQLVPHRELLGRFSAAINAGGAKFHGLRVGFVRFRKIEIQQDAVEYQLTSDQITNPASPRNSSLNSEQ